MRASRTLPAVALTTVACLGSVACSQSPEPAAPAGQPHHPAAPAAPSVGQAPRIAHLTGGVGNKVVDSFDQIRAGVAPIQHLIDDCYESTVAEGGWRENLMWNLDIAYSGEVTSVRPHYAEYWRGGKVVPAAPSPGLAACMDRVLRQLVLPPPVRPGWIRVRFET